MKPITSVYTLDPIRDDSRYGGFYFWDEPSFMTMKRRILSAKQIEEWEKVRGGVPITVDHLYPALSERLRARLLELKRKFKLADAFNPEFLAYPRSNGTWEQSYRVPKLSSCWQPLRVGMGNKKALKNDYPCINLDIPVFSPRAVEVLRPMLEANGELLPLAGQGEGFFAYNLTSWVDAMDRQKSLFTESQEEGMETYRIEMEPEKIEGKTIFRLHGMGTKILVSNLFIEAVEAAGLRGFMFAQKIWPLTQKEIKTLDVPYSDPWIYSMLEVEAEDTPLPTLLASCSPPLRDLWHRFAKEEKVG